MGQCSCYLGDMHLALLWLLPWAVLMGQCEPICLVKFGIMLLAGVAFMYGSLWLIGTIYHGTRKRLKGIVREALRDGPAKTRDDYVQEIIDRGREFAAYQIAEAQARAEFRRQLRRIIFDDKLTGNSFLSDRSGLQESQTDWPSGDGDWLDDW